MVTRMESNSHTKNKNIPLKKIEKSLNGTRFKKFIHLEETGSTNKDVASIAFKEPEDLVFVADSQTEGKGRLGRTWESPKGLNLLCSFLVTPKWSKDRNPLVTSSLALGVVDYLSTIGITALLKWPNDIVTSAGEEQKISGVLAEQIEGEIERLVVGIGLNVSWPSVNDLGPPNSTSLKMLGVQCSRWDVLAGIIENFENQLTRLNQSNGPATLRQDHLANSATIGNSVRIDVGNQKIVGMAKDITEEGFLVVNDGLEDLQVSSGDVVNLRKETDD